MPSSKKLGSSQFGKDANQYAVIAVALATEAKIPKENRY
jgi:hypothetical protein